MAKKRALFAGFGSYGKKWYDMMKLRDDVEVVCAVKRTQGEVGRPGGELAHIPYRPSLAEAIAEFRPDFVFNLTPPDAHFAVGKTALEQGLPVLSEKPVTESLEQAEEVLRLRRAKRLPYVVAQKFRYMAWARTMRRVIEDGRIGTPGQANVTFHDSPKFWPGAYYLEVAQPFLSDYCPHSFDLIRYILGENPSEIFARSFNPSWSWFKGKAAASVCLTFRSGLVVNYYGTWVSTGRSTTQNGNWRVEGDRGALILDADRLFLETGRDAREEIPIPRWDKPDEMIILDDFLRVLGMGGRAETDIEDNIFSMQMVTASVASAISQQSAALRTSF